MNIFNFYERLKPDAENNLTRALAICIEYDPSFAFAFFSRIMGEVKVDAQSLPPYINIQEGANKLDDINPDEINTIYAVSITAQEKLSSNQYEDKDPEGSDRPIPDMIFQLNDILFVCEAKKGDDDYCLAQLKKQVEKVCENLYERKDKNNTDKYELKDASLTWSEIIEMLDAVKSLHKYQPHFLVENFHDFLLSTNPSWFPVKRLDQIPRTTGNANVMIEKRLAVIKSIINNKLGQDGSNDWIPLQRPWGKQFSIWSDGQSIAIGCWAGHTKGQGEHLFTNDKDVWDWLSWNKKQIKSTSITGDIEISPYIRVFPWQGDDIGTCFVYDIELAKKFFTKQNFYANTGRKNRDAWKPANNEMKNNLGGIWDEWTNSNWDRVLKSKYSFINFSMAACFLVRFKLEDIANIDKSDSGEEIIQFFNIIMDEMREIVDNNEAPDG